MVGGRRCEHRPGRAVKKPFGAAKAPEALDHRSEISKPQRWFLWGTRQLYLTTAPFENVGSKTANTAAFCVEERITANTLKLKRSERSSVFFSPRRSFTSKADLSSYDFSGCQVEGRNTLCAGGHEVHLHSFESHGNVQATHSAIRAKAH